MNTKSDVRAKEAFINHLHLHGYTGAKVISSPSDIVAVKGEHTYFFEIKYTAQQSKYFGAATLTEWEAAFSMKDHYRFVVALERDNEWLFHIYTPEEFMGFSTIPPFKIFFNIPVDAGKAVEENKKSKSIKLTEDRLKQLSELFSKFKNEQIT